MFLLPLRCFRLQLLGPEDRPELVYHGPYGCPVAQGRPAPERTRDAATLGSSRVTASQAGRGLNGYRVSSFCSEQGPAETGSSHSSHDPGKPTKSKTQNWSLLRSSKQLEGQGRLKPSPPTPKALQQHRHLSSNESIPSFGSLGSPGGHYLSKELFHQQDCSLEERPARPSSAWSAASPAEKGSS